MRFHAVVTGFRKAAQSSLYLFCRCFIRPSRKTHAVAQPFGSRAYGVKKHTPPPFSFKLPPSVRFSEHTLALPSVGILNGERSTDVRTSSLRVDDRLSNRSVNEDFSAGATKSVHSSHVTTPTTPSTKWELYQEILRLVCLSPPAPFSRLMSIHQRQPALQSVETYNLLLHLSIRHSFSRHTRYLLNAMTLNKIEPNLNTEKLVVRHMVVHGNWKLAWQQTVTRYPSVADIPMPVLLELLAPGTRNSPKPAIIRSRQVPHSGAESYRRPPLSDRAHRNEIASRTALKLPLDTLIIILHRFPHLPMDELARLPARVISYAVRGLIRNGHQEAAVMLTEKHLKTLPSNISPKGLDFARDLVHLHLSTGEIKLANYWKRRRLTEHLFSLHPSLGPNSRTVFLLMRYMRRSKRCGIEAYLFFKDYCTKWGPVVESLEVRRRIIAYAVKQRKFGIAKEISLAEPPKDISHPRREAIRSGPDSLWRVRAWRSMYPRKGKSSRLWRRLVFRLLGRRRVRRRWLDRYHEKK